MVRRRRKKDFGWKKRGFKSYRLRKQLNIINKSQNPCDNTRPDLGG